MKKNLTRDQYIDRLSDYEGRNLWNNSRFGGEVDEFDYFFKRLAREQEEKEKSVEKDA